MNEMLYNHIAKVTPLTEKEFLFVASHFNNESYKKHDFLIQKGYDVNHCYFVLSGLLKLVYDDKEGRQHIISFAMEEWWESDFAAFFTKSKAQLSLQCLEDTKVLSLSLDNYEKLAAELPVMAQFFRKKANTGHVASQNRILSFLASNARDRYEHLKDHYPSLIQRVPKTLLASYIGVSRETLSRLSSF